MSDDVKKDNAENEKEDSDLQKSDAALSKAWEKGNTNVAREPTDQPAQVIDHPEYEPDLSLVGKENKFGTPNDDQKRALGIAVEKEEEAEGEGEADTSPGTRRETFGRSSGQMLTAGTANSGGNAGQGPSLRVHGFSAPGNHMGAQLNYYTIYTTVDITPTGIGALIIPRGSPLGVYTDTVSNSQLMLDKLIETISLRAQPVFMSQITSVAYGSFTSPSNTFAPASGSVWSMSFAIEHNGAWDTMQTGWTNSLNPLGVARGPITGGPTPYNLNPDLGATVNANLAFMAPPFINTGNSSDAATNNILVVSTGPF